MPHESAKRKKLLLIDGHGLAFRAFFALPALNAPDGTPTNAVVGFFNMFRKILDDWGPDLSVVAFDAPGPTFRHESYKEYKANRPRPRRTSSSALSSWIYSCPGVPVVVRRWRRTTSSPHGLPQEQDGNPHRLVRQGPSAGHCSRDIDSSPHKGITTFQLLDERAFRTEFDSLARHEGLSRPCWGRIGHVPESPAGDKTTRDLVGTYDLLRIYENMAVQTWGYKEASEEERVP